MKALVATVATFLSVSVSCAEPVRVLSGEHSDFSRIVLVFGRDVGWSQQKTLEGFSVAFDRSDLELELGQVFDKIPRTRVQHASFDSSASTLHLSSDCDCELSVFWAGVNTLALDVRTSESEKEDAEAEPDGPEKEETAAGFGHTAFPFGTPRIESSGFASGLPALVVGQPSPHRSSGPDRIAPQLGADSRTQVRRMEEVLFEQMGRAATLGVAKLSSESSGLSIASTVRSDRSPAPRADVQSHVRARTVFDVAPLQEPGSLPSEEVANGCFDEDILDVAKWVSEPTASRAISAARERLVSEFDTPKDDAVESLVRTYLAFGFGAEARATIREFDLRGDLTRLYLLMAEIVDQDEISDKSEMERLAGCEGPSALWAVAGSEGKPLSGVNARAVVSWYVRLPDPLRHQLGPSLVDGLTTSGHPDKAAAIRDAIRRTSEQSISELRVVDAQISLQEGDVDRAFSELRGVAAESSPQSAGAMIALLRGMRETHRVGEEAVLTAEAIAFEYRKTEAGLALLEEVALSWSQLGKQENAWRAWEELMDAEVARPVPDASFSRLVLDLLEKGEDGELMALLYGGRLSVRDASLTRAASLGLAEWFVENTDPVRAAEALLRYRDENGLDIRHLQARIALLNGEPSLALSYVSAETDEMSLLLKAKALERLGKFGSAVAAYDGAGHGEDADWARLMDAQASETQTDASTDTQEALRPRIEKTASPRPKTDHVGLQGEADNPISSPYPETTSDPDHAPEEISIAGSRRLVEQSRSARADILATIEGSTVEPMRGEE